MRIVICVVLFVNYLIVVHSMCSNINKSRKYLSFFKTKTTKDYQFLDPDAGYGLAGFDCRCLRNDIEKEKEELICLKSNLEKKKIMSSLISDKISLQDKLTIISENDILPDDFKYKLIAGGLLDDWNYIIL